MCPRDITLLPPTLLVKNIKTCNEFTAVQVVRVADVIVAEAADAVVVE